ncbi:MAG: iron-containing alcohol dehydrogenase [Candidatus Nanopelagicales bacterium]|jgi:alcohol dehydrogenase class IV|nr:iron-containing alcohol dehydrogenase [Candidatus Nanopelagicales bacterium]
MTAPFDLALPARISFGAGRAAELPAIVAGLGERVLVVTGATPQRVEPRLAPLRSAASALAVVSVAGEPTVDDARRAADLGRQVDADVVLAIGGGSAIDLAKATAMLLANGGDPMDYLEVVGRGQPIVQDPLPLVAAPTTSGTGAEVTANAVLAVPEHGVKVSLRHPRMVPRHAVVDPELTLGCPPAVTAAAGMDALTQCLEPYVSNRANPMTDGWARTGLLAAGRSLRAAHADGSDLTARTDLALCSLVGGLALANAKLGAVHGFAGVLGGLTGAAHGAICAALLAPVCRANLARADAALVARFDDVARWLTGDPDVSAEDGITWIERLVADLGIPPLAAHGLRADQVDAVVAASARASSMAGNPVALTDHELAAIYRAALGEARRVPGRGDGDG